MRFFLLVFVVFPLLEILVLAQVGQWLGALATVGVVILSVVVGVLLLSAQGLFTFLRANRKLERGALPAVEAVEGFLLLAGFVLFLIPGLVTDFLGFFCAIPWTRCFIARRVVRRGLFMATRMGSVDRWFTQPQQGPSPQPGGEGGEVIEGEFRRDDQNRLP